MARKFETGKEIYLEYADGQYVIFFEHSFIEFDSYEKAKDTFVKMITAESPYEEHNRRVWAHRDEYNKRHQNFIP
jgi:hypothetical protein